MPLASIYAADWICAAPKSGPHSLSKTLATGRNSFTPLNGNSKLRAAHLDEGAESALRELCTEDKFVRRSDRTAQLGTLAARLTTDRLIERCGGGVTSFFSDGALVAGTSRGTTSSLEENHSEFLSSGATSPFCSPVTTFGSVASTVAQHLNIEGPALTVSSTCTSGLTALLQASLLVSSRQAEVAFAVGAEAPLTKFTAAQMEALGISPDNWELEFPCMPLSQELGQGSGMVLGEGAAAVVVGPADKRTLHVGKPTAIIQSIGSSVEEISSPTGISRDGKGLQRSMQLALERAGHPEIDLILAHAPGTPQGDSAELAAIEGVFGKREGLGERSIPVYSPKWLLGHTFGASGLLSLCLALELFEGASLSGLPYPSVWRPAHPLEGKQINHILINTAGFGGLATSAIVSRPESVMEKLV